MKSTPALTLTISSLIALALGDARMNLYHDPNCRDLYIANYQIGTEECQDPNPGYSSVIIWDGDNGDGELPLLTFYNHGGCDGPSELFDLSQSQNLNLCYSFNFGVANAMGYYVWLNGKEKRDNSTTIADVAEKRESDSKAVLWKA